MDHSEKYEQVREYYARHLWNLDQVKNAVKKSWITEEEFYEITGERY